MRLLSICLLSAALADPSLAAELQLQAIEIESITADGQAVLSGPDSSWQILVTGRTADGDTVDVTHQAAFTVEPQGVVSVDRSGVMIPLADGKASVVARVMDLDARFDVHVQHVDVPHTLDFVTDVAPILTRYGCNSGGCHGKKGGQEGFELALLGFEPELDYDRLVKDGDGYRIDLDDPDNSYLLRKATKAEPHTGGQRFEKDSVAYRVLRRWIAQGAQQDGTSDAVVERIEVVPRERILQRDGRQQLSVLAHMSDGTVREVGRLASFEVNQLDIIKVTPDGLVSPGGTAGVASIMVRYQAHVGVFRAIIPTGEPIDDLPTPRNFVDELVFSQLRRIGIPLSDTCDDGTFIRRATIDIAGRLPTVDELTSFTQDTDSEKFARLITRLVESDDSADYFAGKWASMLRNRRNSEKDPRGPTEAFYKWIRDGLRENRPYDDFVRGVLTATGKEVESPPVVWYRFANEPSAQLEDVAQMFLGQRIQCARCHHHPFEKWSQHDYSGMAAFFSRLEVEDRPKQKKQKVKPPLTVSFKPGRAEVKHPKTGEPVLPTPLEGSAIEANEEEDPRVALANWMTQPGNRFFARVLVNRYWKHFMGRGLVEPEDDLRTTNPPTNPELLDALADNFVKSGFDIRNLISVICNSRTYQLSSNANGINLHDQQNYSRFLPRRLNAEVLLDGVDTVTLAKTRFSGVGADVRAVQLPDNQNGSYFLSAFGRPAGLSVCECERTTSATLAQQLHLINSPEILAKVQGERAKALSKDDGPPAERIRDLYQVALSREPREDELATLLAYLTERGVISSQDSATVENGKAPSPARDESSELRVNSISASGGSNANSADLAFDDDPKTRWSVNGEGNWIQFELSHATQLSQLEIGFDKGDRKYRFEVSQSSDGQRWTVVKSLESNGKGNDVQTFEFRPTTARYFRIVHKGNSSNYWANIHTIRIPDVAFDPKTAAIQKSDNRESPTSVDSAPSQQAWADIIWVLINTKEFQFNH